MSFNLHHLSTGLIALTGISRWRSHDRFDPRTVALLPPEALEAEGKWQPSEQLYNIH